MVHTMFYMLFYRYVFFFVALVPPFFFPAVDFDFFDDALLLLLQRAFALLRLDLLQRSSQFLVLVEHALMFLRVHSFALRAFLFLLASLARALFLRSPFLFSRPRGVGGEPRRRLYSEPFARALALSRYHSRAF